MNVNVLALFLGYAKLQVFRVIRKFIAMFFSFLHDFVGLNCFIFNRLTLFNGISPLSVRRFLVTSDNKKAVTTIGHGFFFFIGGCRKMAVA